MAEIVKFRFEDTFARKLVKFHSYGRIEPRRLNTGRVIRNNIMSIVQFDSEHKAKVFLDSNRCEPTVYFPPVILMDHLDRDFNLVRDSIDWSCIDLGPAIVIDTLNESLPDWRELRPWIEDSLQGMVSVFLDTAFKRLSFDDPGDYFLFKLMWT